MSLVKHKWVQHILIITVAAGIRRQYGSCKPHTFHEISMGIYITIEMHLLDYFTSHFLSNCWLDLSQLCQHNFGHTHEKAASIMLT